MPVLFYSDDLFCYTLPGPPFVSVHAQKIGGSWEGGGGFRQNVKRVFQTFSMTSLFFLAAPDPSVDK